jgi:hypothetical protein
MTYNEEDRDSSRRTGAEDRGWSHGSVTWWPDGREVGVTPCVVCTVHVETMSVGFLVEP